MKLEKASKEAIKYACLKFHYAKSIPVNTFRYSVFNDKNEWCGVILFGTGANRHLATQFGYSQGQVIELVRVALNGKQDNVSKPLSVALKLIKKDCPLVKKIISYADKDQGHKGTIYKATNWKVEYVTKGERYFIVKGKKTHPRSIYGKCKQSLEDIRKYLDKDATEYWTTGKILYSFTIK